MLSVCIIYVGDEGPAHVCPGHFCRGSRQTQEALDLGEQDPAVGNVFLMLCPFLQIMGGVLKREGGLAGGRLCLGA